MDERPLCAGQGEVKIEGWHHAFPLHLGLVLLVGWLSCQILPAASENVWAGSPSLASPPLKGNVGRGREIFNGKGACFYCHGIDGYWGRTPKLEADTAAYIAKLNPPPPDLRNPGALRLKTNKERARALREGHPGTGLFPGLSMTDQDIADTLIYLALLRKDPNPEQE